MSADPNVPVYAGPNKHTDNNLGGLEEVEGEGEAGAEQVGSTGHPLMILTRRRDSCTDYEEAENEEQCAVPEMRPIVEAAVPNNSSTGCRGSCQREELNSR